LAAPFFLNSSIGTQPGATPSMIRPPSSICAPQIGQFISVLLDPIDLQDSGAYRPQCGRRSSQTWVPRQETGRNQCWFCSSPGTTTPAVHNHVPPQWQPVSSVSPCRSPYHGTPAAHTDLPDKSRHGPKRSKSSERTGQILLLPLSPGQKSHRPFACQKSTLPVSPHPPPLGPAFFHSPPAL